MKDPTFEFWKADTAHAKANTYVTLDNRDVSREGWLALLARPDVERAALRVRTFYDRRLRRRVIQIIAAPSTPRTVAQRNREIHKAAIHAARMYVSEQLRIMEHYGMRPRLSRFEAGVAHQTVCSADSRSKTGENLIACVRL